MESDILCPTCLATGISNLLQTGTGKYGLACGAGHVFTDTEELLAMNPKRIVLPPKAPKIQPNTSEFVIRLPNGLIEVLGKRFGQKLNSSIAALLGVMIDPGAFVVVGEDAKRVSDLFGVKVGNADQFVGQLYNLKSDRDQWRQKAEAKGTGSTEALPEMDGDFVQVTLRIGIDTFTIVRDKAKFNGLSSSQYIQQVLKMATDNNWL